MKAGAATAARPKQTKMANPILLARVGSIIAALYTIPDPAPQDSQLP
jgi:hypothetical protein